MLARPTKEHSQHKYQKSRSSSSELKQRQGQELVEISNIFLSAQCWNGKESTTNFCAGWLLPEDLHEPCTHRGTWACLCRPWQEVVRVFRGAPPDSEFLRVEAECRSDVDPRQNSDWIELAWTKNPCSRDLSRTPKTTRQPQHTRKLLCLMELASVSMTTAWNNTFGPHVHIPPAQQLPAAYFRLQRRVLNVLLEEEDGESVSGCVVSTERAKERGAQTHTLSPHSYGNTYAHTRQNTWVRCRVTHVLEQALCWASLYGGCEPGRTGLSSWPGCHENRAPALAVFRCRCTVCDDVVVFTKETLGSFPYSS